MISTQLLLIFLSLSCAISYQEGIAWQCGDFSVPSGGCGLDPYHPRRCHQSHPISNPKRERVPDRLPRTSTPSKYTEIGKRQVLGCVNSAYMQGQAEVVSNSRDKIHQTWGSPFCRAPYIHIKPTAVEIPFPEWVFSLSATTSEPFLDNLPPEFV